MDAVTTTGHCPAHMDRNSNGLGNQYPVQTYQQHYERLLNESVDQYGYILPQGSILSPILFIFYIAEVFQEGKCKTEKYADDATHVSAGDSKEEALSLLQKDCEEITKWIGKWRLKISGPKTEVVIFSSILEEIREPTKNIVLQGNTIKFATESTALGITINNKLYFRAQFEKCSRKAENAMGVLEPLVQNQFITPSTILKRGIAW